MELLPAVMVGGPPNSGKSVLTYHLTQALRERGVQHYVLRAAPDGEGDWRAEAKESLVRTILVPRCWTRAFVDHVCESLAGRPLPLIVDAGGRPTAWQECIFDYCTHAVLLTPSEPARAEWQARVRRHDLIPVADLRSDLRGVSRVTAAQPVLRGVIAGLEWGARVGGPTFDALVERVARLLYHDPDDLRRAHIVSAPVETTIDLDPLARTLGVPFSGEKADWAPHHLPPLLDYLPETTPLGLYGRGPNWLYAAVALHASPEPFYQFDARLGWVAPPDLRLGAPPADASVRAQRWDLEDHVHLGFTLARAYLDYTQVGELVTPPVPPGRGAVLSGKLPLWLYTALALAYAPRVPWLAVYQPRLDHEAVVVSSRGPEPAVGNRVVSPPQEPAAT